MNFTEMDPSKILQMLGETDEEGRLVHQNLLAPLVSKEEAFFRMAACPKCGAQAHEAFVDTRRPFIPGHALPHRYLRCLSCRSEFDPYSGLITRAVTDE